MRSLAARLKQAEDTLPPSAAETERALLARFRAARPDLAGLSDAEIRELADSGMEDLVIFAELGGPCTPEEMAALWARHEQ